MTGHSHERGPRTAHARLFLAIAFILQRLGDVAVIWFSFLPMNSMLWLRGVAAGAFVCTTALLIGVWRRLRWARYLLTGVGWLYISVVTFVALFGWNEMTFEPADPYFAPIAGALLYFGANVILVKSRRVRHFANA